MDDFVLPSFESTRILKDEDAIIIKKKGVKFKASSMICNGPNVEEVLERGRSLALNSSTLAVCFSHAESGDEGHMILPNVKATRKKSNLIEMLVVDQKKKCSDKLQGSDTLAMKDSQGDLQGDDEDVVLPNGNTDHMVTPSSEIVHTVRKRKHSYKHQGSHTLEIKDSERDSQEDEDGVVLLNDNIEEMETSSELVNAKRRRRLSKLLKGSYTLAIKDSTRDSQGDDGVVPPNENKVEIKTSSEMVNAKRRRKQSIQLQGAEIVAEEKDRGNISVPDAHKDVKLSSRSARRKKAKRVWRRTHGLTKKTSEIQIAENDSLIKPIEHHIVDKYTEMDEEIVPVIVHPGHIRFESAEMCSVSENGLVETLQWNGTASKKKGQKWGRQKTNKKWNSDDSYNWPVNDESNDKEPEPVKVFNEESEAMEEVISEQVETIKVSNGIKEIEAEKKPIDFESLLPMTRLPEDGDVLAYRLVELSSSWCPELSPFRIGKISSYESSSSKTVLHVHPEYPLPTTEKSEEGGENIGIYKEDGSLEIDFPSLLDVKLIKAHDLEEKAPKTSTFDTIQTPAQVNGKSATCGSIGLEAGSFHTENELIIINETWEEINKVLSEKKAQLQKENNLIKNSGESTATGSWSYRSLRRNALGPTLALLRGNNDKAE